MALLCRWVSVHQKWLSRRCPRIQRVIAAVGGGTDRVFKDWGWFDDPRSDFVGGVLIDIFVFFLKRKIT